ncbi:peptidoglycan hydrolase CwlO-like protein [Scopulibacillus daqui]|uniref:Peptidoglycan hydrolase CwlO-like protein n=1 Tax=Scopulibacillus daqui TaxID=1469162 RepID=A0ABS2Q383_9BACL|nr:hypothetical protein [Scopulibacillus daqui]MBM7646581.1 peptidoglycan hydrolase CwlO-like protein [Scopulibacillus daqui]
MSDQLTQIVSLLDNLNGKVDGLNKRMDIMQEDIKNLKQDVKEIRDDVKELRIESINADEKILSKLTSYQQRIGSDISFLNSEVADIKLKVH